MQEDTLKNLIAPFKRYNPIYIESSEWGAIWEIDTPSFVLKACPQLFPRILLAQALTRQSEIHKILRERIESGAIDPNTAGYLLVDFYTGDTRVFYWCIPCRKFKIGLKTNFFKEFLYN